MPFNIFIHPGLKYMLYNILLNKKCLFAQLDSKWYSQDDDIEHD